MSTLFRSGPRGLSLTFPFGWTPSSASSWKRGWFQAAVIAILLLALGGILYLAFRTPSAEQLFAQAQRLMETKKEEDAAQARNGPIKDYLETYGDRTDAPSRQVRQWADRYDV